MRRLKVCDRDLGLDRVLLLLQPGRELSLNVPIDNVPGHSLSEHLYTSEGIPGSHEGGLGLPCV